MSARSVILLSVIAVCYGYSHMPRPKYIECQTSEECGKGSCCVIGMGRYSIPTCQPHRDLGDQCRPGGEPVNTTLHYPDGMSVELAGVFYMVCPCQGGFACSDGAECTETILTNHIADYDYSEENNFHY